MREGTWNYTVTVRCTLADAVSLMSDVEQLGRIHPLVTKVVPLPTAPRAMRTYAVTDRLRWGPVRVPITYQVNLISVSELEVVTAARQRPHTSLWVTAQFQEEGDKVHIAVTVVVRAPTLLFPYAYRTGKAAHLQLAERIRSVLEGGAPSG